MVATSARHSHNFWRGEKIRLRAIEQADLGAIMDSAEEPDSWVERADDFIYLPSWQEKARDTLAAERNRTADSFFWLIENRAGETVGNIATFDCDRRVGTFKYSVIIKRPHWRKGYSSEAITLVLQYYFYELRYQKVTALIYAFNQPSIKMHEKLGFTLEGRLRREVFTGGRFYDEFYYGMLVEEFTKIIEKPVVDPCLDD